MSKAKPKKQKLIGVYAIYLEGQGDRYEAIVDKEAWRWLISPTPPQFIDHTSWDELPLAPERVQKAVRNSGEDFLDITCGSTENDRAMTLCAVTGAALFVGEDRGEAKEWADDNNAKIVDYFEGYIY